MSTPAERNLFANYERLEKLRRNQAATAQPVFGVAPGEGAPMSAERTALLASLPQVQQQRTLTFVPAAGIQSNKPMSAQRAALYASLKRKREERESVAQENIRSPGLRQKVKEVR